MALYGTDIYSLLVSMKIGKAVSDFGTISGIYQKHRDVV